MEIAYFKEKDRKSIKNLDTYCFFQNIKDYELYEEISFIPEKCLCLYDNNQLAASLQMVPFEMSYNGQAIPMAGVSTVATFPKYRQKHCVSQLLNEMIKILNNEGIPVSVLGPFKHHFYNKFGWGLSFEKREYLFKTVDLKKFNNDSGNYREITRDDISAINSVYQNFISDYNGAIVRSPENWNVSFHWWERDWEPFYKYGYFDDENRLRGYIVYQLKDNQTFEISEMIYDNNESKHALFHFIYLHEAQVSDVKWLAPMDDLFFFEMDEPIKYMQTKVLPLMMARIINVKKALELMAPVRPADGTFILKCNDSQADWNNKVFEIAVSDMKVSVNESSGIPDVECDIDILSSLFMGYIGAEQAERLGKIRIPANKKELILNLFAQRKTLMTDMF